ncbi:DUF1810 domain-containing protein [Neorhizobium sp. NCHU2750]|uniref:DUF1810 domain-containing protein n=1 Tax=Neorhizobium sp. NCHU2750 TaxID=1825976 RepID=UPI000E725D54|nr:calpastatin [Neorhizobium sp. NCHU2750]
MNERSEVFDLTRFVEAQAEIYNQVIAELRDGEKRSHWMWYIFPQFTGLGASAMSQRFAINSRAEAVAYLEHPLLGWRLGECTAAMLSHEGRKPGEILGSPDDMKFKSSMTLFHMVSEKGSPFERALHVFYKGEHDERTVALLRL